MDNNIKIQGFGLTDVGKNRSSNEDTYFYGEIWDEQHVLALTIDGCGGHKGGAEAARITREAVLQYLHENAGESKEGILKKALVFANNKVNGIRRQKAELSDMCCVATAALVCLNEENLYLAHVGDTRIYASLDGRIIKLSHDHSPVGRDEERGYISETEAMNSPFRNVIERAVGEKYLQEDTDYIEYETFPITAGLTWMLCSDGLCDMITSARMSDILRDDVPLQQKAERLVAAANEAGGKDNITVVIFQAEGEDSSKAEDVMDYYATKLNPERTPDFNSILDDIIVPSLGQEEGMYEENTPSSEEADKKVETSEETTPVGDIIENTADIPPTEPDMTGKEKQNSISEGPVQAELETAKEVVETDQQAEEKTPEPETPVENPELKEATEEEEQNVKVQDIPQASASSRNSINKMIQFIIWLFLIVGVVGSVIAYRSYRQRKAEEFNESIRQELLKRDLYNANDSIRPDTTDSANIKVSAAYNGEPNDSIEQKDNE